MVQLIRVGNRIINLDNVIKIDLESTDEDSDETAVVFEFAMRGSDELDNGTNFAEPYGGRLSTTPLPWPRPRRTL